MVEDEPANVYSKGFTRCDDNDLRPRYYVDSCSLGTQTITGEVVELEACTNIGHSNLGSIYQAFLPGIQATTYYQTNCASNPVDCHYLFIVPSTWMNGVAAAYIGSHR